MRKHKSEVLNASLEEQPLLLSISQDPFLILKVNKCIYTVLFQKEYKGEIRERLPTQRGKAKTSIGVLTRIIGSGAMLVFLCDSARVLSGLVDSGETLEKKTYTLKMLSSWTKLPFPILKQCDLTKFFFVFDWVGTRWTMSIHGVSGEAKVTCIMNQYSLKGQGPVLKMNQNREVGIPPVCCQVW